MKNGFTLVELLAVVAILAMLILIVGIAIPKSVKNSKEKLYESQINSIKTAAEMWVADNIERMPSSGCYYITLKKLQSGYIENDIKNPKTNSTFNSLSTYIKIVLVETEFNLSFDYDVLTTIPDNCTQIN